MRTTALLTLYMLTSLLTFGQLSFGIRAGVNYTFITEGKGPQYTGDRPIGIKYKGLGQDVGIVADATLGDRVSMRFEPTLSLRRSRREVSYYESFSFGGGQTITEKENVALNYLAAPISFAYHLTDGLDILAGPAIGFLLGGETADEWTATGTNGFGEPYVDKERTVVSGAQLTKQLRNTEFGFVVGCDYSFNNGLILGGRFQRILTSIENEANSKYTERKYDVLNFCIGYMIIRNS